MRITRILSNVKMSMVVIVNVDTVDSCWKVDYYIGDLLYK